MAAPDRANERNELPTKKGVFVNVKKKVNRQPPRGQGKAAEHEGWASIC